MQFQYTTDEDADNVIEAMARFSSEFAGRLSSNNRTLPSSSADLASSAGMQHPARRWASVVQTAQQTLRRTLLSAAPKFVPWTRDEASQTQEFEEPDWCGASAVERECADEVFVEDVLGVLERCVPIHGLCKQIEMQCR